MAKNSIPGVAPVADALLAAYLAAHYRFKLAGSWWPLAIGQPAPTVLAQAGPADSWSLLTAWNPQSIARAAAANEAADAQLRAQLATCGLPMFRSAANSPDGNWEEPGWLVAGLTQSVADALAHRHGQAGILHWLEGEPVRLRMYTRPLDECEEHRFVDWVRAQPK